MPAVIIIIGIIIDFYTNLFHYQKTL